LTASQSKRRGDKSEITPLVERLSVVIDLPADFDYKNGYREFLENKDK
jgi:hypothetical protein